MTATPAPMTASALSERPRLHLVRQPEPAVEWTDSDYPSIEPGIYQGYCRFAHWYRDPQFKRWTCLLLFDAFAEGTDCLLGTIPLWFNGGDGTKPRASRRGHYLPAWVKANGGPPARKDRLSPAVFLKRMAKIRVADTEKGPLRYSIVREIIEWETGGKA